MRTHICVLPPNSVCIMIKRLCATSVSIAVLLHFCRSGDRRAARDLYAAAHCGAPQPSPPVNAKCCCGAISLRALTRPKLPGLLCCLCRKQINEPRNHSTRCAVTHYVINNTSTHTHTRTRAIGRESYNNGNGNNQKPPKGHADVQKAQLFCAHCRRTLAQLNLLKLRTR